YYYLPLRLVTANLNNDEQYELLVNKNISLASQFFGRYRSFPQGEIHSLYWDGVGLNLLWKTRRIKGTVVDYGIADVNNDGQRDLYVCIDSYPGASGFRTIRTFLEIYPLDAKKIDPNTPVDPNIDE
ncbi:MAG: VCBS repeat-containing protein, partial [Desulfovibrionales bacterium]